MQRTLLIGLMMIIIGVMPLAAQDNLANTTDIPEPMPLVDEGDFDIRNILLMGSATYNGNENPGLTDSMMIVSFNLDTASVSVVSIPRDLLVYVPGIGMQKVNQAYFLAETRDENRTGFEVLRETMLYNLGIKIDHFARVDFNTFDDVVDSLGGINISVDCAIQDWRLKDPFLDIYAEDSYEMYTLWTGYYEMRGELALWYVRSRRTSNDIDRGRRQQDVVRAIWRTMRQQGLLENFPTLWEQFNTMVDTDMEFDDALALLPAAVDLEAASVDFYTFEVNIEVETGLTDDEGRFVLIPNREAVAALMQEVVLPPNSRTIGTALPTVAIYNASGVRGLHYVAAHRLEREGFVTYIFDEDTERLSDNRVIDLTGETKGNPVVTIQNVLSVDTENIQIEPSPSREFDYVLYVGNDYQFNSCTYPVAAPIDYNDPNVPESTATPPPLGNETPADSSSGDAEQSRGS